MMARMNGTAPAPAPAVSRPLDGIRVLDLTGEMGPLSTRLMAGMGGDVIRIEPPAGHPTRRRAPFHGNLPRPDRSLYWMGINAGKRGVTLGLHTADGRALFRRLAATADFVVESLPVGELNRAGLGAAELRAINPRLIVTSISAYGQSGPKAGDRGTDLIGMAAGGLMFLCGDRDRPPVRVTVEQGYAQAGLHAAAATMVALHRRHATGEGCHVDVSMQEAVTWTLANNRLHWPASGIISHRTGGGRAFGSGGTRLVYPTSDGFISFMRRPEGHIALQAWLDDAGVDLSFRIDGWQGKPLYGDGAPPEDEVAQLDAALAGFFAQGKKGDLNREGQARGLIIAAVATPADLLASEHLRVRGFWEEIYHPELQMTLPYPGAPFKLAVAPWRTGGRAPTLGEHNAEVYGELGLGRAELATLAAVGAI